MKELVSRIVELRREKKLVSAREKALNTELRDLEGRLIETFAEQGVGKVTTDEGVTLYLSEQTWVSLEPENEEVGVQPSERADFVRLLLEAGYDNVCNFNHNSLRSAFGKVDKSEIPPEILPKLRFTEETRVNVKNLGS